MGFINQLITGGHHPVGKLRESWEDVGGTMLGRLEDDFKTSIPLSWIKKKRAFCWIFMVELEILGMLGIGMLEMCISGTLW